MSGWIDVSVPLDSGTVVWPGDRSFQLFREATIGEASDCQLSSFAMSAHVGTHVDAPLHYLEGGGSLDVLDLGRVIGRARVVEVEGDGIGAAAVDGLAISRGERILFKTRNSERVWHHEPFRTDYVAMKCDGAREMAERGASLVGIDYLSIGGPGEDGAEAHRILLGAGVWILESLNLHGVEPGAYELICLPLKIAGAEGAPARVALKRI